ncbi:MAG: phosphotransferase [Actinomycetota bacterium]
MSNAVPTTTADVTAEWLTAALRESGTIPDGVAVASLDTDPAAAGVGFMGEVNTLGVTYDGDAGDAPTRMVIKFPTASPEIKAMMRPTRVYEREHRFYAELADATPVRTPAAYHVTCNTNDDPEVDEEYVLVMEDLSDLTEGDQVAGLSVDQTASALTGLAKHHARFWNGAGMEAASFIPVIDGPLNLAGEAIYGASIDGFMQVFGEHLTDEMKPVALGYGPNHPKLLGRFSAMPHTLVHFDFRADNLFFEPGGDVVVIDWQAISKGGGAADVGYLMGQNLEPSVRREHEQDLLRTYHSTLEANGVSGYEFDQFFDDYRVGLMYGWVIPVFAVGSLDSSSERAMQLWTSVIERVQDAIFQHGAQEFIEL